MNSYEKSKKARRIVSVIYLLILAVIVGGSYLSDQRKELIERVSKDLPQSKQMSVELSDDQIRN